MLIAKWPHAVCTADIGIWMASVQFHLIDTYITCLENSLVGKEHSIYNFTSIADIKPAKGA
jgi:hypothetical protein